MKQMPRIDKFMTTMPHTIGTQIPLKKAVAMMREFHIRHLPVQTEGKLMGVLSDRDIKLASSFTHSEEFRVEDVMTPEPYTVKPDANLDDVVAEMSEHKYGCAVVQQENGKVVGIFTATDGLRVLGDMLKENYKNH